MKGLGIRCRGKTSYKIKLLRGQLHYFNVKRFEHEEHRYFLTAKENEMNKLVFDSF